MLKRKDTKESREYWEFVEKTAAYVNTHVLCFTNHCVATKNRDSCPKREKL